MRSCRLGLIALLVLLGAPAWAHSPSNAFLNVDTTEQPTSLRLDLALLDLEYAVGLDADRDNAITWDELRVGWAAIQGYLMQRLQPSRGEQACSVIPEDLRVADRADGIYAALFLRLRCPSGAPTSLGYQLLFDQDASHRVLVEIRHAAGASQAVLSPTHPELPLAAGELSFWDGFTAYLQEGVWHIWLGFDHVLFLLTLLLPSVLVSQGRRWRPSESLGQTLGEVLAVVTAFTLAHSITLGLAAFGWIRIESAIVEAAIAASVALAALNNLYPMITGRRWLIAFSLGLIHGLGFASVLADLSSQDSVLSALLGFNLGVELGQVAIVALFVPMAYVIRHSVWYRYGVLGFGSATALIIALFWLVERGMDLSPAGTWTS